MKVTRTLSSLEDKEGKPITVSFEAKFLWAKDGCVTFETNYGVGVCLVSECEMNEEI